jgi:hypothetical protein
MMTNKVEVRSVGPGNPECGSLWIDQDNGEIYILAAIGPTDYVAVSLVEGNRFNDPNQSKVFAVQGLRFLGNGVKIIVEVPTNGNSQN